MAIAKWLPHVSVGGVFLAIGLFNVYRLRARSNDAACAPAAPPAGGT